jgi:hypothetical protein
MNSLMQWWPEVVPTPSLFGDLGDTDANDYFAEDMATDDNAANQFFESDDDVAEVADVAEQQRGAARQPAPPQQQQQSSSTTIVVQIASPAQGPRRARGGVVCRNGSKTRSAAAAAAAARNMRGASCEQCRASRRKCRPGSNFGCANCEAKQQFCSHWTRAAHTPLLVNGADVGDNSALSLPTVAPPELVAAMRVAAVALAQHPSLAVRSQAPPLRLWQGEPAVIGVPDFENDCWFIGDVNQAMCDLLGRPRDELIFQSSAVSQVFLFNDRPLPLASANEEVHNPLNLPHPLQPQAAGRHQSAHSRPRRRLAPARRHGNARHTRAIALGAARLEHRLDAAVHLFRRLKSASRNCPAEPVSVASNVNRHARNHFKYTVLV